MGAILSGWRYDISGIPADLRSDYEAHLTACSACQLRQRRHRFIDFLLLAVTTLGFVAFGLAAVIARHEQVQAARFALHLKLHPTEAHALAFLPASLTIGLEAVAIAGVLLSLLLWIAVWMATPVTGIVTSVLRERVWKHAA